MADGEEGGSGAPVSGLVLKSPFQRKKDVFDAEDFQPVKFINQIYPDGGLPRVQWRVRRTMPNGTCAAQRAPQLHGFFRALLRSAHLPLR
jgi:hypothetical protein